MNGYQLLIYGSVLAFVIVGLKKRCPLERYLLLIAVFGGFLFSVLWEGKARYVYPYFLMMIPYASVGVAAMAAAFWRQLDKKAARQREGKTFPAGTARNVRNPPFPPPDLHRHGEKASDRRRKAEAHRILP